MLSDEIVALIELVKNAHDADATLVEVELENVDTKEGKIIIRDDGCGMTLEKVLGSWMELGTYDKRRNKVSPRGRRVLGEKGIGRFAADKLAEKLELITKSEEDDKEVCAIFDWSKYDENVYLEEIKNHIEKREPKSIKKHGTILKLTKLRTLWTKRMIEKLNLGFNRLLSPFKRLEDFRIALFSNGFPMLDVRVREDIFKKAPYQIRAEVSLEGKITCKINEETREIHFIKNKKKAEPECGSIKVELYAWELTPETLKILGMGVRAARRMIKSWSGVNIYRDSFRVLPYGEEGEDWLELDRRRIMDPSVHFSRNQVLGFVEIGSDTNPNIIDQTNREGLIQNRAYQDLRLCLMQIIQQFENYRLEQRKMETKELKEEEKKEKGTTELFDNILEQLSTIEPKQVAEGIIESIYEAKEIVEKREDETIEAVARYHRHLTIGQMANNIIHEIKQPTATLVMEGNSGLIALSRKPLDLDFCRESFEIVKGRGHFINKIIEKWTPFIRTKRQKKKINICEAIDIAFSDYKREIIRINVASEYPDPESSDVMVEMDSADAVMIFHNLLSNSLYWLEVDDVTNPKVQVNVEIVGNKVRILFKDNGLGIKPEYYEKIFLPGWTLKEGGAGLGMSIIGEIVEEYDGKLELVPLPKGGKGVQFKIELPSVQRR